jgi:hypothetical protein
LQKDREAIAYNVALEELSKEILHYRKENQRGCGIQRLEIAIGRSRQPDPYDDIFSQLATYKTNTRSA